MATLTDNRFYRNSAWFFAAFLALTVWAFWPSYFARLFEQPSLLAHAHGVALTSWCVLLVVQAQLLRTGRRPLHRALGKASYVLVPALLAITVSFVHDRMGGPVPPGTPLPGSALRSLALMLNSLVAFALFYGLAIGFRRDRQVHGRYMLCTVFPLFTPVTDRLIAANFPELIAFVPRIDGSPVLPVAGFLLADAILLALGAWDWRQSRAAGVPPSAGAHRGFASRRRNVFPIALAVLLVYHASVLTLHRSAAWSAFCSWFLSLPLS